MNQLAVNISIGSVAHSSQQVQRSTDPFGSCTVGKTAVLQKVKIPLRYRVESHSLGKHDLGMPADLCPADSCGLFPVDSEGSWPWG